MMKVVMRVICVERAKLRYRTQIKHFSATFGFVLRKNKDKGVWWFWVHCWISIPGTKKLLKRLTVLHSTQRELLKTIQHFENRNLNRENGTANRQPDNGTKALVVWTKRKRTGNWWWKKGWRWKTRVQWSWWDGTHRTRTYVIRSKCIPAECDPSGGQQAISTVTNT